MNLSRRIEKLEQKAAVRAKTLNVVPTLKGPLGLNEKHSNLRTVRSSLLAFIQATKSDYVIDPFHVQLCHIMERFYRLVVQRKRPRFMVFAPPRHGKSQIVSRHFPAWVLGKSPSMEVAIGAYGTSLGLEFSSDVQDIMSTPEYHAIFPRSVLSGTEWAARNMGARRADYFRLVAQEGRFRAIGRKGSITGKGKNVDVLLIDDPIKDHAEAESPAFRDETWHWYNPTLITRLQQGGGVMITLTRWHLDDLAGRLLEMQTQPGADQWEVFTFPALEGCENCDGCRDNSGGVDPEKHACRPLAPHRFSHQEMLLRRANMVPKAWDALYQGSPSSLTGGILPADKWKYYGGPGQIALPDLRQFSFIVASWDSTFAQTEGADFCCGQVWACRGSERWLLDYILEKMSFTRFKNAIREMRYKHPRTSWTLIENKANGPAVIDTLHSEITGLQPIEPEGGKIARAWAASSDLAAGNIFIPDPSIAPWVGAFVHRCAVFPANLDKAGSDDDVDAFTQMLIFMRQYQFGAMQWSEEQKRWEEHEANQEIYSARGPNGEDLIWDENRQLWYDQKTGQTYEPDYGG